jgi:sugar/nucleoside kinase (ribokinase family)
MWQGGGGPVPTALIALARWGMSTAYLGRAGDDTWGRALRDEFEEAGVDVTGFELEPGTPTPHASIWVEQGSGTRTAVLGQKHFSQPKQLRLDIVEAAAFLHIDARDPQLCATVAQHAQKSGVVVSLDVGSPRMDVLAVLPHVDHLIVAEPFAQAVTHQSTPQKMLDSLGRGHHEAVVITFGLRGAIGTTVGDTLASCGAYRVQTVDTTGAGDIYHAGYLYGALQGWPLKQRMVFAAAAGALAATKLGARGCVPPLAEVERLASEDIPVFEGGLDAVAARP